MNPDLSDQLYGGGPMREDIAEYLAHQGVKMSPILGLSETGCITTMVPSESHSPYVLYLLVGH